MTELIKEERYIFSLGTEEFILRVQEFVWGSTEWPGRFRVYLPASDTRQAKRFYGMTAREAVELAAEYITSPARETETAPLSLHFRN